MQYEPLILKSRDPVEIKTANLLSNKHSVCTFEEGDNLYSFHIKIGASLQSETTYVQVNLLSDQEKLALLFRQDTLVKWINKVFCVITLDTLPKPIAQAVLSKTLSSFIHFISAALQHSFTLESYCITQGDNVSWSSKPHISLQLIHNNDACALECYPVIIPTHAVEALIKAFPAKNSIESHFFKHLKLPVTYQISASSLALKQVKQLLKGNILFFQTSLKANHLILQVTPAHKFIN